MSGPVNRALEIIGNKHKYQYLTFGILFLLNAYVNLIMVGPTFIFMNPLFDCQGHDKPLDEPKACPIIDQCTINSPFTIVAQLSLYCDKQFDRSVIQSVYSIGSVCGMLIINFLSDHKGRKVALLIVQICGIVGTAITLLGGQYKLVYLLSIGQFFCGSSGYCMMIQTYLYLFECCQQVFRQRVTVALNYAWCITFSLLGILYYYYNYWRDFLLYISLVPMLITLALSWSFLVQGPGYLYRKQEIGRCLESLRFIAKMNGTVQKFKEIQKDFRYEQQKTEEEVSLLRGLKKLLTSKKYLKITIILCFSQSGANLYYWATNYSIDQIGFEYGTNLIASGVIEALSFISIHMFIEKVPRKKALLLLYSLMAGLGFLFFIPGFKENIVPTAIILGLLRYMITMAYMIVIILLTEAYPPNVQSIGTGFVEAVGQAGAFLGPVVVNLCIAFEIYPIIVISVIAVVMIVIPMTGMVQTRPGSSQIVPQNIKTSGLRFVGSTEHHVEHRLQSSSAQRLEE